MKIEIEFFASHVVYTKDVSIRIEDPEIEGYDEESGGYMATLTVPLKQPKLSVRCGLRVHDPDEQFFVGGLYIDDKGQHWLCTTSGNPTTLQSAATREQETFNLPPKTFKLFASSFKEGS